MSKPDGGHAFPGVFTQYEDGKAWGETQNFGMSLRDYFAGHALTGILSEAWHPDMGYSPAGSATPSRTAAQAYEFADAMLEAREVV